MLSEAKHLAADRDRPFAEFTLSETNVLRVTLCVWFTHIVTKMFTYIVSLVQPFRCPSIGDAQHPGMDTMEVNRGSHDVRKPYTM
jgi:hypothetical protein